MRAIARIVVKEKNYKQLKGVRTVTLSTFNCLRFAVGLNKVYD